MAARVNKGSAKTTFIVGAMLTLPRGSYLAGLSDIHKLHESWPVTVLIVIGFNAIMLWLLEVPLASFLVAPDWTPSAIARARAWVGRNALIFAIRGCLPTSGWLRILKEQLGSSPHRQNAAWEATEPCQTTRPRRTT